MKALKSFIFNFPKHILTAVKGIYRNGAMSISSIISVTITLTLIMVIGCLGINITDITYHIEDNITIYAQVNRELSDVEAEGVAPLIEQIEGVKSVTFSSKDNELDILIESLADDEEAKKLFESYREDNPLGAAFTVEVYDITKIEVIAQEIAEIEYIKEVRSGEQSTATMVETLDVIRQGAFICIIGLAIVALFMIVNTVKMTINARKAEIEIMRVIGASNSYIRTPFVLEGALIGLLGAVLPIVILILGYETLYTELSTLLPAMFSLRAPIPFVYELSGVLALAGAVVGLIASYLSVSRYLKF